MQIKFLKFRWLYFTISGILVLGSLVCLIVFGLKPGIDFTGGSILELEYKEARPDNQEIINALSGLDLGDFHPQPTEERGVIIRMKDISEETHQEILERLRKDNGVEEMRFETIGPVIGNELKDKTKIVVILSLLAILAYIALAFRKLTWPLKSWQYGIAALIALGHDGIIPIGVFALLGYEITIPVVVAVLTVLGYSINDTVVLFDRIREKLLKREGKDYEETVEIATRQSVSRSLNTSFTTLITLAAIYFLGGETLKYFALALIIGVIAGTWSSLFLAGPILVSWLKWRKRA